MEHNLRKRRRQLAVFYFILFYLIDFPLIPPEPQEPPDAPHRTPQATDDNGEVASAGLWGTWGRSSPFLRFLHAAFNEVSRESGNPGRRANGDMLVLLRPRGIRLLRLTKA